MNSKFFVSLEAARLLKEKGFDEKVEYMYDDSILTGIRVLTNSQIDRHYRNMYGIEFYGAPTKAEAIDWLDTKEIVIEISSVRNRKWRFSIYKNGWFQIDSWIHDRLDFSTRLEAEEAAIIRACELL